MISSGSVRCWKLWLLSSLTISIAISSENFTLAQIAPDTTLGSESSVITPLNPSTDQIDGGAIRGKNLFHSFQEFNVDIGRGVYFSNPAGIENILSRVTGNNPSKIFGKLGVLGGNANLFLINPNGIIFGSNASLNVGGSFVATTANAIGFSNQGFFSASAPNAPSVLTVNPSALLFNQIEAGSITNNSREPAGQRLDPLPSDPSTVRNLIGLRVPDGKSLLLLGGNVNLNGGGLNALGGRVELGGVVSSGTVGLDVNANNISLSFPNDLALADISLSNRARIDTSGEGSGNIQVQGKRITLSSGSQIAADTLGGSKSGGAVVVNASDSVNLIGRSQNGILSSRSLGVANAGEITINTGKLTIRDGAQVLTSTNNQGSGGKLTVNAFDSIELIGTSAVGTPSGLFTSTAAAGNAGDITINTGKLIVRDGAVIATETASKEEPFGNITLATGQGGNLTVKADDSIEVIGTDAEGFPSYLSASAQGSGDGGNVKIATGRLVVRGGAEVSVSSQGTGNAGNLQFTGGSIRLDNGGKLSATSQSGSGGDITLKDLNLLLLRGNSEISTSAGGSGKGGNIKIDTDLLVGTENSDITANAFEREGGFIQITSQGIFGLEVRKQLTENSDITAFSEKDPSLNGVVEINRPDIDPNANLVILPAQIIDISGLVASGCPAGGGNLAKGTGELVVTGRGGLPPTPTEATRSDTTLVDLGTGVPSEENRPRASMPNNTTTSSDSTTLVEAQGWVIGSKGEVILTANPPTVTPQIPWLMPTSCNGS